MEQLNEIIKKLHDTRSYIEYTKLKTDLDNLIETYKRQFIQLQKNVTYWKNQPKTKQKSTHNAKIFYEWKKNDVMMRNTIEALKSMILARQQYFFEGSDKFFNK